jgi:hypothetical protein
MGIAVDSSDVENMFNEYEAFLDKAIEETKEPQQRRKGQLADDRRWLRVKLDALRDLRNKFRYLVGQKMVA